MFCTIWDDRSMEAFLASSYWPFCKVVDAAESTVMQTILHICMVTPLEVFAEMNETAMAAVA